MRLPKRLRPLSRTPLFSKALARAELRFSPNRWSPFGAPDGALAGHVREIDKWKQGDLIRGLSLAWVTREISGKYPVPEWKEFPYTTVDVIICSQTCDIALEKSGASHPFILVAPLVEKGAISDKGTAKRAEEGNGSYLFPVSSPADVAGTWFADLRLIFPISKEVLIDRTPIEGISDPRNSLIFAERIAHKFRRPALSEALSEKIPESLNDFANGNKPGRAAFANVEEVRIRLVGDRLKPSSAGLMVMEAIRIPEEEREYWQRFDRVVKGALKAEGIEHQPVVFVMPGETVASIALYQQSVPLINCDRFPVRYW